MKYIYTLTFSLFLTSFLYAQEKGNSQDLALKLANPVAKLINVPFNFNVTQGIGNYNGSQLVFNFQPVIPITIGKLNIVTRTIVPFIENRNIISENSTQFGISDINFSAFLTPSKIGKFIWGVGPAFSIPTASKAYFGSEKWSVGPTAVILKQFGGLTAAMLVRQIWSIAGNEKRGEVNQLLLNPGLGYSFKSGASLGGGFDITENWNQNDDFQAVLNLNAGMVSKFGHQPVQFNIGPKIPLNKNTPGDWGLKATIVLIFTK